MSISNAQVETDVFKAVRNAIVSANIVLVNTATSTTDTPSVLAVFNDKETVRPQIVMQPASMSESEFKFRYAYGRMMLDIDVMIYARRTADLDEISGKVQESVRNMPLSPIDLVAVSTDYGFTNPNETKYHLKTITFTFDKE